MLTDHESAVVRRSLRRLDVLIPQIRALTDGLRASLKLLELHAGYDAAAAILENAPAEQVLPLLDDLEREADEATVDLNAALRQLSPTPQEETPHE